MAKTKGYKTTGKARAKKISAIEKGRKTKANKGSLAKQLSSRSMNILGGWS